MSSIKEIAYLLTVRDVVSQGRYSHQCLRKVEKVIDSLCSDLETTRDDVALNCDLPSVVSMQIRLYCMVGGGFLGRFAAEQPAGFYIDQRVGKLPYRRNAILTACTALVKAAKDEGLDPSRLPEMPLFHNCGIF